jgi:hypothetical protein
LNQKSLSSELNTYLDKISLKPSTLFKIRIIGILILSIGFIFFLNSIVLGVNIAVTFILIGIFIVILPSKKNTIDNGKDIYIIGFIIIWIIIIFFITIHFNLEILFILNFLGILVSNEITNKISSEALKLRLNLFVFLFFLFFIIVVITKIIKY